MPWIVLCIGALAFSLILLIRSPGADAIRLGPPVTVPAATTGPAGATGPAPPPGASSDSSSSVPELASPAAPREVDEDGNDRDAVEDSVGR